MFYIGDDSVSTLNLITDVLELTNKEVNTSDIRLIILYDGPEEGDSKLEILDNPLNKSSRIIDLEKTIIKSENDEIDMANTETLSAYITYAKKMLPANNYALYFGSHGTGFNGSYNSGVIFEGNGQTPETLMSVKEIAETLADTDGVDLVTFDACLIGNIETVYELKDSTSYVIASPELIPGPGNDYLGFVKAAYSLNDLSAVSLGKATLESHYNYYDENASFQNGHEAKSLQQLYHVDKIAVICESEEFKDELIQFKQKKDNTVTTFDNGNYSDIFDLIEDNTTFNEAITIPENGIYRWISIYIPEEYNFNDGYESTKFAINNPDWVEVIKN